MKAHKNNALKEKYSVSLMSNHKWHKLFCVMAEYGSNFSGIEYHFTDTDKVYLGHAPSRHKVWATAIDDPVEGYSGPVEYKHIERILIPENYVYRLYENGPIESRHQDLKLFITALAEVGCFPVVMTAQGIEISGYET